LQVSEIVNTPASCSELLREVLNYVEVRDAPSQSNGGYSVIIRQIIIRTILPKKFDYGSSSFGIKNGVTQWGVAMNILAIYRKKAEEGVNS
jgi:hypothetical protein